MFYLALQHLISRKKQTLFTFVGVFFAACAFVVISGFFAGFQDFLADQLVNNDAHIRISAKEEYVSAPELEKSFFTMPQSIFWISPPGGRKENKKIEDPSGWMVRLEKDPRVQAFSPQVTAQILINRAGTSMNARLIGADVLKQIRVTNIAQHMTQGKFTDLSVGGNRTIVGDELLALLGARISETVLISNGQQVPFPFKVIGSFHTGIRTLDQGVAFAALADVQKISNSAGVINEIAIRVNDVEQAFQIAKGWRSFSEEKIQSWDEINANVLNVFAIQNATKNMMTFVIVLVAGFGVYNILNMVVTQKRKDIAILRSMGFTQGEVVQLFLSQGVLLGVVGGLVGVLAGYLICLYLETIPFGGGPLGTGAGHLTISYSAKIYIQGLSLGLVAATLASYLPARAAGKCVLHPAVRAGERRQHLFQQRYGYRAPGWLLHPLPAGALPGRVGDIHGRRRRAPAGDLALLR